MLLALSLIQPLAVAAQPASAPTGPAPTAAPAPTAGPVPIGVPPLSSRPVTYGATVLKVENGQVLLVRIGAQERRVRLACVQAPRPAQEPWATQAGEALQRRVPLGSPVQISLRARDVFGRLVAVVRLNGRDVAPSLLRQGALFAFDGYLGQCADLGYPRLEREARQSRQGVWSVAGGIERPWNLLARQGDSVEEP
ncbi:thermonuclease family protein [Cyanobium sp. ATX 6F1]|uniref:thermonuclease family protein n=1 Tax=unclassified Cyanobium TaxID=2627006 RepID=UPI0020CC7ADF|nr:thermonuclease family protein [Cyanobium sp. ATX 6F1]MCP9914896.1 thermonuclease family protein [Cyanobium sp. ATX 6F1]